MVRVFIKIGVCMLVVIACSGLVGAADLKLNSNPCHIPEVDADGLNRDLSVDIDALRSFTDTTVRILKQENFDELDCLADRARSEKERLPGGLWKIHMLYQGLRQPGSHEMHATQEDWKDLINRLERWVKARPESITARVALALVYLDYAQDARGSGYSNTVSESGWKLYGERTGEAERILKEASKLGTKCPEWYVAMQMVSVNQGWSVPDARALFEESYKFEPDYYTYARDLAYYLLPKWSGEPGDTEKFVKEIADRTDGDKGDILYFQVAAADYVICGCKDSPQLSWDRIKRGFEASEKRFGASMLNLNRIAYLATYYGDHDPIYAAQIFARIGEQRDTDTWPDKAGFDRIKEWASAVAPMATQIRVSEDAAKANAQTPEGAKYKVVFEKTYRELLQQCVKTDGGNVPQWEGKFKTLIDLNAKGMVENLQVQSEGPVVACLYKKVGTLQGNGTTLFPPPPQGPFWIELSLDWAEFAPVFSGAESSTQ